MIMLGGKNDPLATGVAIILVFSGGEDEIHTYVCDAQAERWPEHDSASIYAQCM